MIRFIYTTPALGIQCTHVDCRIIGGPQGASYLEIEEDFNEKGEKQIIAINNAYCEEHSKELRLA